MLRLILTCLLFYTAIWCSQQGPSHRQVAPDVHKVFAGVSGGLTDEGLASLALFLPSDVAHGAAHNLTATGHRIRHGSFY